MVNTGDRSASRLPLSLCVGWGIGTLGISIMFNTLNVLMQRFATDYLGVAAITWGYIYLGAKIYDAVTDPVMGVISDHTRSRWGRRRPYLLIGGLVSAIAFYGLFHAPDTVANNHAVLLLALLMLLYSTGYTIFNVPYMAMPAEMTSDYHARSHLVSFRVYAIGFGTIAGLSLAPLLIGSMGGGKQGHESMATIYALAILATAVACFIMTRSAKQTSPRADASLGFAHRMKLIATNRPFLLLIGVKFTQLAGLAINQAALVYFIVHVLGRGYAFLGIYGLIASICLLLAPPLCLFAGRRYDKRLVFIYSSLFYAAIMLTWLFSGPEETTSMLLLRGALLGLSGGAMLMMGQAMLPDTIGYDHARSGLNREGVFAGIYTTAEKLAFATGGALAAFVLGYMGYQSSTTGYAQQPDSAIVAIYLCMGVLPAVMVLLSCLFLYFYDLDELRIREMARSRLSVQR
ncbi:MAG: glycoside-pentoside-hexuronide (GPH):cation symporter [Gammaproteobacteria bacterium]|nr:glycoside-pentoside-hexuronide (GPH):cation symporter [Gammaproteobacteria bacterium]MDE0513568.1 glycoside-pentoside-hexuronide (GPH):cation symporter [Gammaproteobacteria bacterium]